MAAWLNKWLILSFLPFISYTGGNLPGKGPESAVPYAGKPVHPFHVSVVEINYNASDKIFEISCKLFTDDFETVLAQNYPREAAQKTKLDLINPPDRKLADTLIKKYINTHLSVSADGKTVPFTYLGFEHETDAVYCYVQADNILSVKKIAVTNKLMHDLFQDQINLMHVTVGKIRKSYKLDYPKKEVVFGF